QFLMIIQDIPYRSLPNQPELFLQYLELQPAALQFFEAAPILDRNNFDRDRVLDRTIHRSAMASILRRQNQRYACSSETLDRIEKLANGDSVAILTGQQVGLFTGPLYTIYKALTAVRLADELSNRGIGAVAVFWLETEDHDLDEVTNRTILNSRGSPQKLDCRHSLFSEATRSTRPVGSIVFPESISNVINEFTDHLPDTEWKQEVRSLLGATYRPGTTFAQGFATLLHKILHGSGLILFDPHDPEAKPLASEVFHWALDQAPAIRSVIRERDHEIESAGFQPQVKQGDHSTVLFYIEDDDRCLLEMKHSRFRLKNRDRFYSLTELQNSLKVHPEKFSPSALLRPIVQDTLFPTLAYVAGPAEVAYFAQAQVLYKLRGLPMPVIWPREGFTLLDTEIRKKIQNLNIEIQECLGEWPLLKNKILQRSNYQKNAAELEPLKGRIETGFASLEHNAEILDPLLPQAMETAKRKIKHNVQKLQTRLQRIEESRNVSKLNTANLLRHYFLTNGNLQERELNFLYFYSLHGPAVLDAIRDGIRLSSFAHRILSVD
ncbi:MAG: bacillithiol biosynthesis cysteine-adding enzyme BshC, partial [Acidobacteriota bacterium]